MFPLEIQPATLHTQCLHSAGLEGGTGAAPACTLIRLRELIHVSLVVSLNCRNVPYNWNSIIFEFITLPSQKTSLAGMAGDSLPSCFTSVHKKLHILHYPGSKSEDKLWWRDLFPAILEQRMISLRYNSTLPLTFPSTKGWMEPGLLQLCIRCHRWASFFFSLTLEPQTPPRREAAGLSCISQ